MKTEATDDQVAGFDLIPNPDIYARQHGKLVKSYIIDSVGNPDPRPANPDTAGARATEFLRSAAACPARKFPSIGYGTDHRYQSQGLAGAALVHEDQIVHAAFFRLTAETKPAHDTMASLRARRRRYVE